MEAYNSKVKILDDIQSEHGRLILLREKAISEDQIREWYNEDYASNGSLKSYESYRSDILAENEKRMLSVSLDIERNNDLYFANLYHLTKIKTETRRYYGRN